MNRLSRLFRPAAHVSMLPGEQIRQLYPKLRWRILESTFIGCAAFYFVCNNLPVVPKEMGQALGYRKGQIGDMLAMTAMAYGIEMISTTRGKHRFASNRHTPARLSHIGSGAVNTRTHSTETIFLRGE